MVFLLGAGFSTAANPKASERDPCAYRYPIVRDLAEVCFPSGYDLSRGIEYAFAAAQERADSGPIDRLIEMIQDADHNLGSHVARDLGSPFHKLLERFPGVDFLTFNYDCLVESLLLKRGVWNPVDGFGVRAEADTSLASPQLVSRSSSSCVLHLHGSLYIYPVEFLYEERATITLLKRRFKPRYVFDPGELAASFLPYCGT